MAKSNGKSNLEKQLEKEEGKKEVVQPPAGEVLFPEEGAEPKEVLKAEVQKPAKEEKTQVVTPEMLASFKSMREEIKSLREEMNKRKPIDEPTAPQPGLIKTESILDDYLDVPVVFFAFQYRKTLFADFRRGVLVPPPHDKKYVFFERLYRYENRKGSRGESEMISICQVKIRSAALVKWMREHSLFGISFFETMTDAMSVDTSFQDKLAAAANAISRYSEHQIIERAKIEGLTPTSDLIKLRKDLIAKLARNMMTQDEQRIKDRNLKLSNKQDVEGREVELVRKAVVEDGHVSNKY